MAENSKIEWTTNTFNPWIGCTNISPGCDHCYAEAQNNYRGWTVWGAKGERKRTSPANWKKPLQWQKEAADFEKTHGHRLRVFCASLADVFDNKAPQEWREDLFALIRQTPSLDWQLLTKRPQNIERFLPKDWGDYGYRNVWLGTTCENAEYYRQRWPVLEKIPAVVRFISYEPAIGPLGPLALDDFMRLPDWIISGGESGGGARTMQPEWAREVLRECREHGVAFFHKQWGTYRSNPLVIERGMTPREAEGFDTHGKGGGLLDGNLYREFPAC
jgi:protein gp37